MRSGLAIGNIPSGDRDDALPAVYRKRAAAGWRAKTLAGWAVGIERSRLFRLSILNPRAIDQLMRYQC
jgi:hypothetical protein